MGITKRIIVLLFGAFLAGVTGCDSFQKPWKRKLGADSQGVIHAKNEEAMDPGEEETRGIVKSFFKNNRLPGSLSKEAQAIENNLGVTGELD